MSMALELARAPKPAPTGDRPGRRSERPGTVDRGPGHQVQVMLVDTHAPQFDPRLRPDRRDAWGGSPRYRLFKQRLEFIGTMVLATIAVPIVAVAAFLVKLTSRGPAFYSQTRLGEQGKAFTIYKLRTMQHDCERLTGARWAEAHDPRITRVGWYLRKLHVDELPQLWNVLKGEMSLIGPRPERPEFVPQLERAIPHYGERLWIRPGLTGLAQVQLPPDTDLQSVRRKLGYDLYYLWHVGPALDCRILLATAFHLLGVPFGTTRRLLWLPTAGAVDQHYRGLASSVRPTKPSVVTVTSKSA